MISDKLIPRVKECFTNSKVKFGAPPEAAVVFPAVHPDVGDIEIYDEGFELTLIAGHFTHGHFSDFDSTSEDEAEQRIVDDVIDFLKRLFADQVTLWGSHISGGGWCDRDDTDDSIPDVLVDMKQGRQPGLWNTP
jgi:hypothetical protein